MEGRIKKQISNQYKVRVNRFDYICSARVKLHEIGVIICLVIGEILVI